MGVAGGGGCEWCGLPGQHSPRGGKMNIVNEKMFSALNTYFELLSEIKGNPKIIVIFLKFVISGKGGHCDCSPRAPKT
jgi:hypothetical protein